MGGALEVGYLYVALTPPSIAWRAAAVSRILREVQSSCMIFIFTVVESNRGKPPVKRKKSAARVKVCTFHADFLKKPRSLKNKPGFYRALA